MPNSAVNYWVYILHCENGSLYTGYTHNLEKRFDQHQKGTGGCKYTKAFKPIRIAQSWEVGGDQSAAMKIESLIKKLTKSQKQALIDHPERFATFFAHLLL